MDLPSLTQQKVYIIENVRLLDRKMKLTILSLVMTELSDSELPLPATVSEGRDGVHVNLDSLANPELITSIYNIVRAQHASLNVPV